VSGAAKPGRVERVEAFFVSARRVRVEHGWGQADDPSGRYEADWTLEVEFQRPKPSDPGAILKVQLAGAAGITASEAQRFGWSKWLRVAEGVIRNQGPPPPFRRGPGELVSNERREWEAKRRAAEALIQAHLAATPRPGKKGRPEDFYRAIADLYLHYSTVGGQAHPTKRIADQFHVPRNTVAGWVRKARDLAPLPRARRGKAG
jgi:hypothetical protein